MAELLPLVLSIIGLIMGVVILVAAIYALRCSVKQAAILSQWPTYSKSVNKVLLDSGIYTEHGMVTDEKGFRVKPQSKRSKSFFESCL